MGGFAHLGLQVNVRSLEGFVLLQILGQWVAVVLSLRLLPLAERRLEQEAGMGL
jgi:hypothetical protein